MSQASHLPIYNTAFDLLKDLHQRVPKFAKLYKYSLGEKLLNCAMDTVSLVTKANNERDIEKRVSVIGLLIQRTDDAMVFIRLAEELKLFNSAGAYLLLTERVNNISRQAVGWKKSYLPRNSLAAVQRSVGKEMPLSALARER